MQAESQESIRQEIREKLKQQSLITQQIFLYNQDIGQQEYKDILTNRLKLKMHCDYKKIGLHLLNEKQQNNQTNKQNNQDDNQDQKQNIKLISENIENEAAGDSLIIYSEKQRQEEKSIYEKEIDNIEANNKRERQIPSIFMKDSKKPNSQLEEVQQKQQQLSLTDKNGEIMAIVEKRVENKEGKDQPKNLQIYDPKTNRYELEESSRIGEIMQRQIKRLVKPKWQRPWELERVICGHQGWVRCLDVDMENEWLVSGGNDRCIKFWDLASGTLKLSLTGHINTVRKVLVSRRHAYLYSCGEDKSVKCWDLEYNKVVRSYHGHLSGVYSLAQHPSLDVLASGGRDSTVRLWDIRTRAQIHVLSGHDHVVSTIQAQQFEPQLVSGSHDNTAKLWDLVAGKCLFTITNHKKAIRNISIHPIEYTFLTAAADNLKVFQCPQARFLRNFSGHNAIVNATAINPQGDLMVSAADNGSIHFWDWTSGYNFQAIQSKPQPGSISAEAGVFDAIFDHSGLKLITAECDKTIKIWRQDPNATPETHPIDDIRIPFDNN